MAPHFFFLLSGYILSIVYLRHGKDVPAKTFYVARFARIYPLYLVSVLADVPFLIMGRLGKYGLTVAIERVMALLAVSTFMMQMWLRPLTVVNIPSWSLAVETVFYVSFPLIGPWLWKAGEGEDCFNPRVSLICSQCVIELECHLALFFSSLWL